MTCDCKGDLGYAHKECLKKWADEKQTSVCEICGKNHADINVSLRDPTNLQCIESWARAMTLDQEGLFFNNPLEIRRVEQLYAREAFRKAIITGYVCFIALGFFLKKKNKTMIQSRQWWPVAYPAVNLSRKKKKKKKTTSPNDPIVPLFPSWSRFIISILLFPIVMFAFNRAFSFEGNSNVSFPLIAMYFFTFTVLYAFFESWRRTRVYRASLMRRRQIYNTRLAQRLSQARTIRIQI